jgi:aspartate/glutamate racemase
MDDPGIVQDRLRRHQGLQVRVPGDDDRAEVHRVIYDELCRGVVLERSRGAFRGRHRAACAHKAARR